VSDSPRSNKFPGILKQVRIVLVRPKDPRNLGATARAMTNMGFSRLTLVSPECSINDEASAVSVGCTEVLEKARVVPGIAEAVKGAGLVVGFTRRVGKHRPASRSLRENASRWVQLADQNEIAFLFGPEDYGLTGDDLAFCQEAVRIPTAEKFPSINLAQAVMLVCYEVLLAASGTPRSAATPQLAPAEEREALLKSMFEALQRLEYFGGRDPTHSMTFFRQTFDRAGLSSDDVRLWRGVFERVIKRIK
jgi:tRNA/rRNA methyltransferase